MTQFSILHGHQKDDFGYGLFLDKVFVSSTEISISNTQFVNYSRPAMFINSLNGTNSSITMNNVSFIGNKMRYFVRCVHIVATIGSNFTIAFVNSAFLSNNGDGIVSIYNEAVGYFDSKFIRCLWRNNSVSVSNVILYIRSSKTFNADFVECAFEDNIGSAIHVSPIWIRESINCNVLQCAFLNNTSTDHGAALYMLTESTASDFDVRILYTQLTISQCSFAYNTGGRSIVYIADTIRQVNHLILSATSFTNNVGSALFVSSSTILYLQPYNLFRTTKLTMVQQYILMKILILIWIQIYFPWQTLLAILHDFVEELFMLILSQIASIVIQLFL